MQKHVTWLSPPPPLPHPTLPLLRGDELMPYNLTSLPVPPPASLSVTASLRGDETRPHRMCDMTAEIYILTNNQLAPLNRRDFWVFQIWMNPARLRLHHSHHDNDSLSSRQQRAHCALCCFHRLDFIGLALMSERSHFSACARTLHSSPHEDVTFAFTSSFTPSSFTL